MDSAVPVPLGTNGSLKNYPFQGDWFGRKQPTNASIYTLTKLLIFFFIRTATTYSQLKPLSTLCTYKKLVKPWKRNKSLDYAILRKSSDIFQMNPAAYSPINENWDAFEKEEQAKYSSWTTNHQFGYHVYTNITQYYSSQANRLLTGDKS